MRMQRGFSVPQRSGGPACVPQRSGGMASGKVGRATDKINRHRAAVVFKQRSAARTAPLAPPHPAGCSLLPVIEITGKQITGKEVMR